MSQHNLDFVKKALAKCRDAQDEATCSWHTSKPADTSDVCPAQMEKGENGEESLICIVRAQHLMNFTLWHVEDEARRKMWVTTLLPNVNAPLMDITSGAMIFMEKWMPALLICAPPNIAPKPQARFNTESIGAAVDRMSIISLKIYHMARRNRAC
jgi:hypothetical protein